MAQTARRRGVGLRDRANAWLGSTGRWDGSEEQAMGPKNMHFIDEDCSKSSMGCGNCGNKTFVIFQKKGTDQTLLQS
jgi:hypothetical protein